MKTTYRIRFENGNKSMVKYVCLTNFMNQNGYNLKSTLLYFFTGAATILFCIAAYYALLKLPLSEECLPFGLDKTQAPEHMYETRKRLKGKRLGSKTACA